MWSVVLVVLTLLVFYDYSEKITCALVTLLKQKQMKTTLKCWLEFGYLSNNFVCGMS